MKTLKELAAEVRRGGAWMLATTDSWASFTVLLEAVEAHSCMTPLEAMNINDRTTAALKERDEAIGRKVEMASDLLRAEKERDELRRSMAAAMECEPDDDADLIEAVRLLVKERDGARAGEHVSNEEQARFEQQRDHARAERDEARAQVVALSSMLENLHPRSGVWRVPGSAAEEAVIEEALDDTAATAAAHDAEVRADERRRVNVALKVAFGDSVTHEHMAILVAQHDAAVRRAALEEAAGLCKAWVETGPSQGASVAGQLAMEIRALAADTNLADTKRSMTGEAVLGDPSCLSAAAHDAEVRAPLCAAIATFIEAFGLVRNNTPWTINDVDSASDLGRAESHRKAGNGLIDALAADTAATAAAHDAEVREKARIEAFAECACIVAQHDGSQELAKAMAAHFLAADAKPEGAGE